MTTSHKTKWREARMRLKNRDVMTIFNRDGTTTEVEHPFSALQALHNEDCNDLTKYISRLELNIEAFFARIDEIERRLSALEKPRAEKPHAREWMTGDTPIWMAFIPYGKTNWAVRRGILAEVAANDLWMPYDPEHPEPPAPPESEG